MAGSKHERSGGFDGSGEVSPLAAQLQQAWLQSQMPKVQKRSFMSVPSNSGQPTRLSSSAPIVEQSALKSLSSIFPELVNMPEEKKPMIFSVLEDGEEPTALPLAWRKKKAECLGLMFEDLAISEKQHAQSSKSSMPQTRRSFSATLIERSSGSSEFAERGPLSSSHSFSGCGNGRPYEPLADAYSDLGPDFEETPMPTDLADFDPKAAAEVAQEKTPLFSYLSDILMDENVEDKKCMFVEMSAYQAMAKELGDLIGDPSPSARTFPSNPSELQQDEDPLHRNSPEYQHDEDPFHRNSPELQHDEDPGHVESWIEEMLSGPFPAELRDGHDKENGRTNKNLERFEEFDAQTDSRSWSSNAWDDGRDNESEVAESQMSCLTDSLPSVTFEDAMYRRQKESGLTKYVGSKPVMPPVNGNGVHIPPVDLTDLLIRCAQAVEQSDFRLANELIGELRHHSSAYGNAPQRMAHYFMEALVARMSGTGGQLYSALANNRPSEGQMLKGFRLFCDHCPFLPVSHSFANHTILQAIKDAPRVHIVDYGILYGVQWPCLIHQLAQRVGGPPHLRITGIDRPKPGFRPSARIQETGRRLARLAKDLGVPFEFHAIAEKWEAITPAHLLLKEDEVLAVNCMFRLRHLLDETVTAASPRALVLSRIRSMNPKVFVQGVMNAGYNAPFFMSRFREALAHFSTLFDAMEGSMPVEHPDRQIIDQEIFGREILNVVACEGLERVERTEPYRQWQARTLRAGFQQMPISSETSSLLRMLMKTYNRNYGMGYDGNWFLLGWKERILHAITAWEPAPVSP